MAIQGCAGWAGLYLVAVVGGGLINYQPYARPIGCQSKVKFRLSSFVQDAGRQVGTLNSQSIGLQSVHIPSLAPQPLAES